MFFQKLLQLFYPTHCVSCHVLISREAILCSSCFALIQPVVSLYVPITKKHSIKILAAGAYLNSLKHLVKRKFSSDILASKQLARLMLQTIPHSELEADFIVPIPMHWTRYAWRGYNQAKEMARVIGKEMNIPVKSVLRRRIRTQFQSRLDRDQRQENMKDIFVFNRWPISIKIKDLKGKKILLIDDLYTTGATLKSAAKILFRAEPHSITAIVGCRAI